MKPGYSFFILFLFLTLSIYGQSTQGTLLSQWRPDSIQGSALYNNAFNEIWGYEINGNEYAIIGSTHGTHFVNVTDPENPVEDFFVKGASSGGHIVHRDYHDFRGYLYAVAGEDIGTSKSTLQIIDLHDLPNAIDVAYDSRDRIRKAHNIFIDSTEARLYVCSAKNGDDPGAALRLYDISEPLDPKLVESYSNGIGGAQIGHVHDAFVRNNIAFLNAGFDGLLVVDFTDAGNPIILSHLLGSDYPESGYNHSGWLDEDGHYYYMGDETWGKAMKVFDVSDPRNILLVTKFDANSNPNFSIAHNQIVHCNYLFVSYYYDGLQVFDITNPSNPVNVLFFPTCNISPHPNYEGAWGIYPFLPSGNILVSDMQNGLFVIKNFATYCTPSKTDEEKIEEFNITIFPNPSHGNFDITSEEPISKIKIFDINGMLLFETKNESKYSFQLNYLKSGIYFVEIYIKDIRWVEKIIIQK